MNTNTKNPRCFNSTHELEGSDHAGARCPDCNVWCGAEHDTDPRRPGTWYLAPDNDPADEFAAGYDGNSFATRAEAEREIPALLSYLSDRGWDPTDDENAPRVSWIAVQRQGPEVTK